MNRTDLKGSSFGIGLGAAGYAAYGAAWYGSGAAAATGAATIAGPCLLVGAALIAVTANRVRNADALIS
jgi:hypothetical protein